MKIYTLQNLGFLFLGLATLLSQTSIVGQTHRTPSGGRIAVVVDERLAALRDSPAFDGALLRRLGRGRFVAIRGQRRSRDGILFCHVNVTRRTAGWMQCDALISRVKGEDSQLLRLIEDSKDFERIARSRIFLDLFLSSAFRARVLLIFGDTAEAVSERLSRDAARRLDDSEVKSVRVPVFTYFLNYSGLDRYSRQGVRFIFDRATKRFHYSGTAWREIVRRYPNSPEAIQARQRLTSQLSKM